MRVVADVLIPVPYGLCGCKATTKIASTTRSRLTDLFPFCVKSSQCRWVFWFVALWRFELILNIIIFIFRRFFVFGLVLHNYLTQP